MFRDTVSSVGIIPRSHPYTSVNYAVKHFRHALALDERRARFRPNVWGEATLEREQDLDVDEPAFRIDTSKPRDEWVYEPPNRDFCDVQEVWFSGTIIHSLPHSAHHAEIGQVVTPMLEVVHIATNFGTVCHTFHCDG